MYTTLTLLILLFIYSTYKIKKICGSWKEFNPAEAPIHIYIAFVMSTVILTGIIIGLYAHMVIHGIIP